MHSKLILKKLSPRDLVFFKSQTSIHETSQSNGANGFTLHQNILVDKLYPSLPAILENKQNKIMLSVSIYGPGLATEYNIQRKIQKKRLHEDYLLLGELIADPEDNPDRFHSLRSGDFVIFDFLGEIEPHSARAVFVSQNIAEDIDLHALLDTFIGSASMIAVQSRELERLIADAQLTDQHPANLLILEARLEDAALGGVEGVKALRRGPFKGKVSRQTLEQARKNAQKTGRLGEELVSIYLESKKQAGLIKDFYWDADDNAITPHDFSILELDDSVTLIDVKSTKGNFDNPIHVSYNELLQMKDAYRYDLYRVFDITGDSAELRIANSLKEFAENMVTILQKLPSGVQPDGISITPSVLDFGKQEELSNRSEIR